MSDFAKLVSDGSLDLKGGLLVEASAGTGKTYNIQNVYLRLVVADGLRVQNILVVTFTEAATQELRERLRQILMCCETHLATATDDPNGSASDEETRQRINPILALPLAKTTDGVRRAEEQLHRVRRALMDFDSAAIFTIHGFCNRVLERYAFECGHDPDAELIPEAGELIAEVCRDWWRRNTYANQALAMAVPFKDLGELLALTSYAAKRPDAALKPQMDGGACRNAETDFIEAVMRDLKCMPQATPTNEASRPIEQALQALLPYVQDHSADNLPQFRQCALAIVSGIKSKTVPRWNNPVTKAKPAKIELAQRLPGATETAPAVFAALLAQKNAIVTTILDEVRNSVLDRNAITYDAMLSRVRDALRDPQAGSRLLGVLREEFHAALVDEFQDTDPVQYETFHRVFLEGLLPLLLVGDPKQSIYGFRSGDIFTYYRAKGQIRCGIHSLGRNFRSEETMVAAVNEFFRDGQEADRAFLNEQIYYSPVNAHGVKDNKRLTFGKPLSVAPCPMKLWLYAADGSRMPGVNTSVARQMCRDVADEIVQLLDPAQPLCIGERSVRPSDIAVLVHTHSEAARLRQELTRRGVNAIRQATDNVFESPISLGIVLVMQAMLEPGNGQAVRSALCSGLFPCSSEDVRKYNSIETFGAETGMEDPGKDARPHCLEEWVGLFRTVGECWHKRSFIEAFRMLADRVGLYSHLARSGEDDADERLAAVQQLVELAHQAAVGAKLGPGGLFRWFVRQMDEDAREEDDSFKLRPASDDDAVKIMTVFKAKGLEFPIVFVPTLWRREAKAARNNEPFISYHDPKTFGMILDLDRDNAPDAQREKLEEDIRLAYVALTRAANRTYLLAVDQPGKGDAYAVSRLLDRWKAWREAHPDEPTCIEVQHRTVDDTESSTPRRHISVSDSSAILNPYADGQSNVDKRYGQASFTSLAMHGKDANKDITRDIDAADDTGPAAAPASKPSDIFLIPGGAQTGDCWHSLFETLDFQADAALQEQTIDAALDQFNLCIGQNEDLRNRKRLAVHAMVARVLTAALPAADPQFTLRDVPFSARRSEMAFQFPLRRHGSERTTSVLANVLKQHWNTPARNEEFLSHLSQSDSRIPLGFMTGSIDLLFEHGGRFYIVDWKSNRLDGQQERFRATGLAQEMTANSYYLQYLIYTAAADGFLRQSLSGYDYERHFGGVFYVFLRGVDGRPGYGIFHDRPSAACITALSDELMREEPS